MKPVTFRDSSGSAIRCGLEPHAARLAVEERLAEIVEVRLERRDLPVGPDQGAGRRVVAVGLQLAADPLAGRVVPAVEVLHVDRLAVEVVGGEVGPEIGPVAVDRPVLHQAVGQEMLLPLDDVLAVEEDPAPLVDDPRRDRGRFPVGADRRVPQDREAEDQRQDRPTATRAARPSSGGEGRCSR